MTASQDCVRARKHRQKASSSIELTRVNAASRTCSDVMRLKEVSHIHESMCVAWGMLLRLLGLQAKQDVEWQQSAGGRGRPLKRGPLTQVS